MSERATVRLGLDIGTRRIGVAVSDPSGGYAMPLETVETRPLGQALDRLVALIREREVEELVVGWPVEMSGVEGRACERTARWVDRILTHVRVAGVQEPECIHWDERLTSHSAEASLLELDVSRRRRKEVIDQVAATHILGGYLRAQALLRAAGDEDE